MEDLYQFHDNSFSSTIQAFSIQSGVFFYISVYRGYFTLKCHNFKAGMQKKKKIFKMAKSITRINIFNGK